MRSSLPWSIAFLLAATAAASAHHKPGHQIPPGQMKKVYNERVEVPQAVEYVCLVTTDDPSDPYARVARTQWLPRSEAVERSNSGEGFIIFHPDVNHRTGCVNF